MNRVGRALRIEVDRADHVPATLAKGGDQRPVRKQAAREDALVRKIRSLPPEKVAEVEDFVEFLSQRDDRQLTQAAAKLAEKAFRRIWNNPADAAYDRL